MTINLSKDQSINLSKESPSKKFRAGLGWNEAARADVDLSLFCLRNGKLFSDQHLVFYNNLQTPNGAVKHSGDCRSGAASQGGLDENLDIDTSLIEADIDELSIVATVHSPAGATFKTISTPAEPVRTAIFDESGKEICRFDLPDVAADAQGMQFGSLIRNPDNTWSFKAVGQGAPGADLGFFLTNYK